MTWMQAKATSFSKFIVDQCSFKANHDDPEVGLAWSLNGSIFMKEDEKDQDFFVLKQNKKWVWSDLWICIKLLVAYDTLNFKE